jgi:hypothetical protein
MADAIFIEGGEEGTLDGERQRYVLHGAGVPWRISL